MSPLFRSRSERLEVEHFLRGMAVGLAAFLVFTPLAALVPIIGFNLFLLLIIVPYYAGYLAGKRTDYGIVAGFVLAIIWTGIELIILAIIGNAFAFMGRVRVNSIIEIGLILVIFSSNAFFCAYGGRIGSQKRLLYRRVVAAPPQSIETGATTAEIGSEIASGKTVPETVSVSEVAGAATADKTPDVAVPVIQKEPIDGSENERLSDKNSEG